MALLSMICLVLVAILCAVGTFHPAYDDNLLQRVGMAMVSVASVALWHHVRQQGTAPPACFLMASGLLMFALGVAQKVVAFKRKRDFEVHP